MKLYVVGFLHYKDEVVLLRKSRPPMLAGKLNGIGGKIEPGEHAVDAMVREFAEETGLQTSQGVWRYYAEVSGDGYVIAYFTADLSGEDSRPEVRSTTDEAVGWYSVPRLPVDVVPDTRWLIPLSLDLTVMTADVRRV